MEKDALIRQRQQNLRQTNAYAMQGGVVLGLWAIGCQACYVLGITHPTFILLWELMFTLIPVLTLVLTFRFRKVVGPDVPFTFGRGFMFAFLTLMYTAVWASVATFVYMQFFDGGYIFDAFERFLNDPAMARQMQQAGLTQNLAQSSGGLSPKDVIGLMRTISAADWAAVIIYSYILTSPIIALIVGVITRRKATPNL